jgi:VanZ family protein
VKDTLRKISRFVRPRLLAAAPASWLGAAFVQEVVRPAEFDEAFNPFLFFDWAPSLLYALGFALFFLAFRSRTPMQNAIWVGLGAVGYEALQTFIPERTVDWLDFAASFAAIPVGLGIYQLVLLADRRRHERHTGRS